MHGRDVTRRVAGPASGEPCRGRRAVDRADQADPGFSLVETVVALFVFSMIMGSLAGLFIRSSEHVAALRDRQQAAFLAAQVLEVARSVPVVADEAGCVPLLRGRSAAAVEAQWSAAPAEVDLSVSDRVSAATGCTGSAVLPLQGLPTSTAAVVDPVAASGQRFTVRTYVGTCRSATTGGACTKASTAPSGILMYRVTAAVSWPDGSCGSTCTFAVSTLLNPPTDPVFDANSLALYPPTLESAVPGDGQVALTWAPPLPSDVTLISYTATATPIGGAQARTCTVSVSTLACSVTGLTNGVLHNVSVVANTSIGDGPPSNIRQVRPYPAAVMSKADTVLWLDGGDAATVLASSSCSGAPATATVGCWKDKSPSKNDAVQATTSRQARVDPIGDVAALRFDGLSTWYTLDVDRLPQGSQPMTIYAVAVQEDSAPTASCFRHVIAWGAAVSNQGRMLHKTCGSAAAVIDTFDTYRTMPATRLWPAGRAAVASGSVTATTVTLRLDGGASYTWTGPAATGRSAGALLGSAPWWPSAVWTGRIAEVLVLDVATTAAQDAAVLDYLHEKWAVPLVPGPPAAVGAVRSADRTAATVTWIAPTSAGSEPVTSYTVTGRPTPGPGAAVVTTCAASPCVVPGLSATTTYSWTVTSSSAAGTGDASAAVSG